MANQFSNDCELTSFSKRYFLALDTFCHIKKALSCFLRGKNAFLTWHIIKTNKTMKRAFCATSKGKQKTLKLFYSIWRLLGCGTFENSLMHCFSDYFHREAYDLIHVGTVVIISNHNYSVFSDHHAGAPLLTKHWKDQHWRKGKKREESCGNPSIKFQNNALLDPTACIYFNILKKICKQ